MPGVAQVQSQIQAPSPLGQQRCANTDNTARVRRRTYIGGNTGPLLGPSGPMGPSLPKRPKAWLQKLVLVL